MQDPCFRTCLLTLSTDGAHYILRDHSERRAWIVSGYVAHNMYDDVATGMEDDEVCLWVHLVPDECVEIPYQN